MLKKCLLVSLSIGMLELFAVNLPIVKDGKSDYRIICPSDGECARLISYASGIFSRLLEQGSGAKLIVVKDKDEVKGRFISIGHTRQLKQAGFASAPLGKWEYRIEVKDGNIYLYGDDRHIALPGNKGHYQEFFLGSVKAICSFLEQFAGAAFVSINPLDSVTVGSCRNLSIPDSFSFRRKPVFEYCIAGRRNLFYDLANNLLPAPDYGQFGGHSHVHAIPPQKYFASHPEYFAEIKGKRTLTNAVNPQYCLSNPQVRELIYAELLRRADSGFTLLQLAQSDGFFSGCECAECVKLYDVKTISEKLWCFHRDLAQRLLKDRPGKQVSILAYGPTKNGPESFRDFPENVVIDLCPFPPFSKEYIIPWRKYMVPGGFTVYLYNWGFYHYEGFTPHRTFAYLATQAKAMRDEKIRGIYCCGFGESYGLEGPAYYLWGKLLEDPQADTDRLLKKYCQTAFGPASDEMECFFRILDRCIGKCDTGTSDWNDPKLLSADWKGEDITLRFYLQRYSEADLTVLEKQLAAAEKKFPSSMLLKLVRLEFDYLQKTVRAVDAFVRVRKEQSSENRITFLKAVAARNHYIASLPKLLDGKYSVFSCADQEILRRGGRLKALLPKEFLVDAERKLVSSGEIKADGKSRYQLYLGKEADVTDQNRHRKTSEKTGGVSFVCTSSPDFLDVAVTFPAASKTDAAKRHIAIFLGPDEKTLMRISSPCMTGRSNVYALSNPDRKIGEPAKFKAIENLWNFQNRVIFPAPEATLKTGEFSVLYRIDKKMFTKQPVSGEKWTFNLTLQKEGDWRNVFRLEHDMNGIIIF